MSRPAPVIRVQLVREGGPTTASITCPADAMEHIAEERNADREMFLVLMLDARNRIIGKHVVSIGSLSATIVHPREVYKAAVLASAHCIVCVHNHPSGDVTPSQDDKDVHIRLKQAGDILGIEVLDSLVVSLDSFYSFKEHGL